MYPITIDMHAAGIPCKVRVSHYKKYKGNYSSLALDPDEYFGWTELDYLILDRKGYRADWLSHKLEKENLIEDFESDLIMELDDHIQGEWENKQDMEREERKLMEMRGEV